MKLSLPSKLVDDLIVYVECQAFNAHHGPMTTLDDDSMGVLSIRYIDINNFWVLKVPNFLNSPSFSEEKKNSSPSFSEEKKIISFVLWKKKSSPSFYEKRKSSPCRVNKFAEG